MGAAGRHASTNEWRRRAQRTDSARVCAGVGVPRVWRAPKETVQRMARPESWRYSEAKRPKARQTESPKADKCSEARRSEGRQAETPWLTDAARRGRPRQRWPEQSALAYIGAYHRGWEHHENRAAEDRHNCKRSWSTAGVTHDEMRHKGARSRGPNRGRSARSGQHRLRRPKPVKPRVQKGR